MKVYQPKTVIFVTTSIETGILLLPNPVVKAIIMSCLALAQFHHPIKVCHYFISGTHIHFIILVENPDDIKGFFERFKTESAHRINILLGRRRRTVWCESMDAPVVLDVDKVIDKIAYLYANAAQDNLVDTIDEYPGLSSWAAFEGNFIEARTRCPLITRPNTPYIGTKFFSLEALNSMATSIKNKAEVCHQFVVTPQAWLKAFSVDQSRYPEIRKRILAEVRRRETDARSLRKAASRAVIGKRKLEVMVFVPEYQPDRDGRRTFCLASDRSIRKQFIEHARGQMALAKEVLARWRLGDFAMAFPLGLFPPSFPKLADSMLFFFDYPLMLTG